MSEFSLSCPVESAQDDVITMAHGAGGKQSSWLQEQIFRPAFDNSALNKLEDAAVLTMPPGQLVMTTDSYVINPLIFPGGDIGELAVTGTVNDLAMKGATPLYLTVGLILEEGLPLSLLQRVVVSMAATAREAGVQLVAGDTKVVERGKADQLFINTAGVGVLQGAEPGVERIAAGDVILLSGDIGRHGVAVMAERQGLGYQTDIESDCARLSPLVAALQTAGVELHALRDMTRGGMATTLIELAEGSGCDFLLRESVIPIEPQVAAACEILGLNPHYVANEGRFALILPAAQQQPALAVLQQFAAGANAAVIGEVEEGDGRGQVILETTFGSQRVLYKLSGDQLPRIC